MARPWKGSRVTGRWMPEIGTWIVTDSLPEGWEELSPENDSAQGLAGMSPSGKVFIRRRELTRLPDQQEELQ